MHAPCRLMLRSRTLSRGLTFSEANMLSTLVSCCPRCRCPPYAVSARSENSLRRRAKVVTSAAPLCDSSQLVTLAKQLYTSVWSRGEVELLDSIMAEDHDQWDVVWQPKRGGGRDRMKKGISMYRTAYPDVNFSILSASACEESQTVTVEWQASGTQTGSLGEREPTGKASTFRGVSVLQISDGMIAQTRVYRQPPEDELLNFLRARVAELEAAEAEQRCGSEQ